MQFIRKNLFFVLLTFILGLSGCSPLRFVPEGQVMLNRVKMDCDNPTVKVSDYRRFVRQEANNRWLSCAKVPLGIYCMSGTDSTNRFNRFIHRLGEAPVIYDPSQAEYSCLSIEQTLQGRGYLEAKVDVDTVHYSKGRRSKVTYHLHPGKRYYVSELRYKFDDPRMEVLVMSEELQKGSFVFRGMPLDASLLNEERKRIVHSLQDKGYYGLHMDFISFDADTLTGDYSTHLTLDFRCPEGIDRERVYMPYKIDKVRVYENCTEATQGESDTYHDLTFFKEQGMTRHVGKHVLTDHIHQKPGKLYSERDQQYTYQNLNNTGIIHYTSIHNTAHPDTLTPDGYHLLDTDIFINLNKEHGISAELEGTNTAGDLGAAASLTYTNRNTFHGAEALSLKIRGAFEAIRGLEGYTDANYIEYGAELNLRTPRGLLPLKYEQRRKFTSHSDFSLLFNSQDRPEFHRRIFTGAWDMQWHALSDPRLRHRVEFFSLNYLFLPWISETFRKNYLDNATSRNSILRYSYEDLFILKIGYGFTFNSLRKSGAQSLYNTNGYQVRLNTELAGSMLYGLAQAFNFKKNNAGEYLIANIPFSQYFKIDFDFSKSIRLTERSSLAMHAGVGAAIPFGNSTVIPYEKRYFSGGANSVRGWAVRELGPGSFVGQDGKVDFINQTGNLKLDLSLEYRAHLFWKIDGAVFIDAGNIWNTRDYEGQEAGTFHWNTFAKQIAVAYGLGLRLNFDYFILRFDGGMKAINPAVVSGKYHYPIIYPNFKRDFAFHFAVGLPF